MSYSIYMMQLQFAMCVCVTYMQSSVLTYYVIAILKTEIHQTKYFHLLLFYYYFYFLIYLI